MMQDHIHVLTGPPTRVGRTDVAFNELESFGRTGFNRPKRQFDVGTFPGGQVVQAVTRWFGGQQALQEIGPNESGDDRSRASVAADPAIHSGFVHRGHGLRTTVQVGKAVSRPCRKDHFIRDSRMSRLSTETGRRPRRPCAP
jgi:hypothetical protein